MNARILVMAWMIGFMVVFNARADIFEYARPSDTDVRAALEDDRHQFYAVTGGVVLDQHEKVVSAVKKLGVDARVRQASLRDTQTAFDKYLKKELGSGQIPKNDLSSNHPLVLLEYSSPVLADVMKHYRMAAFERLGLDQALLAGIERSTENRSDRLGHQSEKECLKRNADKGLVEAMHVCMKSSDAFDALVSVDGQSSLQDGRRRIHVLLQALERLGLEKTSIQEVVSLTGDVVISDSGYEDYLPQKSFYGVVHDARLKLKRVWEEALVKFQSHPRVGAATLETLSLPGSPVTARTFSDLDLMDESWVQGSILKLSSIVSMHTVMRRYDQATNYLEVCGRDPALPDEFVRIVTEKKAFLKGIMSGQDGFSQLVKAHHDILAELARAADDKRRELLDERSMAQTTVGSAKALLLHQ